MAFRARDNEMCLPEALSISGEANKMADVSSRSHNASSGYLFTDDELLTHFAKNFPLSQDRSWKLVTLTPESISKIVSTLRGQTLTMAQWTSPDGNPTGTSGECSPADGGSPPISRDAPPSNKPLSSAPLLLGSGKETMDSEIKLLRNRWIEQSEPLARPSSWPDSETRPRSMAAASALFNSAGCSRPIGEKTQPPNRS